MSPMHHTGTGYLVKNSRWAASGAARNQTTVCWKERFVLCIQKIYIYPPPPSVRHLGWRDCTLCCDKPDGLGTVHLLGTLHRPQAWELSGWLRTYTSYLQARLDTIRQVGFDAETENSQAQSPARDWVTALSFPRFHSFISALGPRRYIRPEPLYGCSCCGS